jgi:hypothetical protein
MFVYMLSTRNHKYKSGEIMEGDIIVGIDGTDVENQVSVVSSVVA